MVQGNNITPLPDVKLSPMGWDKGFDLLENSKTSLNGYRRLQEYFINKYKFLFVNISGFNKSVALPKAFKLRFKLSQSSENTQVNINSFKLFCTPAINLFDTTAEPIALDHKNSDLVLKPIRNVHNQHTVYSILGVQGQNRRSSQKTEYLDFSLNAKQQSNLPVYELIQKSNDNESSNVLRVSYPQGLDLPMREVLTANIRCSNGNLTQQLKVGDINVNTPDVADLVSFKNISAVSEYIPPQTDGRILWNLLAHLTVNYLPITDLSNLKVLLNLYNPTNQADAKEQAANKKRIESLKSISINNSERLLRGYLIRGQQINLNVDGVGFASNGDLYLFGELLSKVFVQFCDINSFVELTIYNENTGEQLTWQPNLTNH